MKALTSCCIQSVDHGKRNTRGAYVDWTGESAVVLTDCQLNESSSVRSHLVATTGSIHGNERRICSLWTYLKLRPCGQPSASLRTMIRVAISFATESFVAHLITALVDVRCGTSVAVASTCRAPLDAWSTWWDGVCLSRTCLGRVST